MATINTHAIAQALAIPISSAASVARSATLATATAHLHLGGARRLRAALTDALVTELGLGAGDALSLANAAV